MSDPESKEQQELNIKYTTLAAQLGDLIHKRYLHEESVKKIIEQCNDLLQKMRTLCEEVTSKKEA